MTLANTSTASDVELRTAGDEDEPSLRAVHAQAHCEQLIASVPDPSMAAALTGMQYRAQQAQYRAVYPDSVDQLVTVAGEVVGRCWTDLSTRALRVLDIAIVPAYRRRGVATDVMTLQLHRAAAAGVPVVLSVWSDNGAARRLYEGLGFTETANADAAGYLTMTCIPRSRS